MRSETSRFGAAQVQSHLERGSHGAERWRTRIAVAFTGIVLVIGGGGSSAPLSELQVELCTAIAAAAWLMVTRNERLANGLDRRVVAVAGLILLLPCIQLIPMPPLLWQRLPGRETERNALELLGLASRWMPWSIAPSRTWASLLSLAPPLLAMTMTASLNREGRARVIETIAVVVLASLVLGAFQLSAGVTGAWRPYGTDNLGFLNGFQANRNAQADVVLIGLVAATVALKMRVSQLGQSMADLLLAALAIVMVSGCILTGSRAGIALIPIALIAIALIRLSGEPKKRTRVPWIGAGCVLLGGAFVLLRQTGPFARTFERFALGRDFRMELWADTRFAISQYWPFGSGIGSFRPAYIAAERLEVVVPTFPVRAHNDYLELALEAGLFGLALLAVVVACVCWMCVTAWLRSSENSARPSSHGPSISCSMARPQIVFAFSVLAIVGLHSIVDYPLRSMAIACLAGIAAGLLAIGKPSSPDWEFKQQ